MTLTTTMRSLINLPESEKARLREVSRIGTAKEKNAALLANIMARPENAASLAWESKLEAMGRTGRLLSAESQYVADCSEVFA